MLIIITSVSCLVFQLVTIAMCGEVDDDDDDDDANGLTSTVVKIMYKIQLMKNE